MPMDAGDKQDPAAGKVQSAGEAGPEMSAPGWYRILNMAVTDIFFGALALYVVLLIIEVTRRNSAAYFVNLNVIAWVVFAAGAMAALTSGARAGREQVVGPEEARSLSDIILAVVLGAAAAALILTTTIRFGNVSLLVSMGLGFILVVVSFFLP